MSNNAELIKAIKDAENALTKAINTLKDIATETESDRVSMEDLNAGYQAIAPHGASGKSFADGERMLFREVISLRKRVDSLSEERRMTEAKTALDEKIFRMTWESEKQGRALAAKRGWFK